LRAGPCPPIPACLASFRYGKGGFSRRLKTVWRNNRGIGSRGQRCADRTHMEFLMGMRLIPRNFPTQVLDAALDKGGSGHSSHRFAANERSPKVTPPMRKSNHFSHHLSVRTFRFQFWPISTRTPRGNETELRLNRETNGTWGYPILSQAIAVTAGENFQRKSPESMLKDQASQVASGIDIGFTSLAGKKWERKGRTHRVRQ